MGPSEAGQGVAIPADPLTPEPLEAALHYGAFELGAAVGHGGTATVYRATLRADPDRRLALKEPTVREPVPETVRDRFRAEAETWTALADHHHVVTVHGWDTDPHPWIAMEYMDAGTLAAQVGQIEPARALWTCATVAAAVAAGHRDGVIHRDLTPANVLLSSARGDGWPVPKVADWGMVHVERAETVNLEGLSPRYAAPEQFDPDRYGPPSAATDVHQLGVVLYELLVGSVPFEGPPAVLRDAVLAEPPPPATGRNPALPAPVDGLLDRALAKSPADRYDSMDAFRQAIERTFISLTGHEPAGTVAGVTDADLRVADSPDASTATRTDTPYRRAVDFAREGFVQLSEGFFARRDPVPPLEAWRRGVRLVDARAGRAVERTVPADDGATEDRVALAEDLIARLRAGTDTVVLGPPGSGKSTVCKRVACEWFDRGHGRVLYRESGTGPRFDRPDALARWLGRTDGDALVVAEDAVRPEVRAVFEVLERVRDTEGVTVLLDARESEWREPGRGTDTLGTDPVSRGRATVAPVYVPRPDRREHERFVAVAEAATDGSLDVDVDRVRGAVERATGEDGVDDDPRPGELFYLLHRLTSRARDPLSGEEASTTLTDSVADVHGRLADVGDRALDVGVCVNLVNAAGIGVHPELLYAVVPDAPLAVEAAVDVLEGRVLFPRETDWSDGTRAHPAVHEAWSVEFLAHGLEADPEAAAERFGRVLEGVLSLGRTEPARQRVANALQGSATYFGRIEADPSGWLDRTLEAVFGLAAASPRLAPLFGTAETSTYDLPAACPTRRRLEAMVTRADAHRGASDYEAASTEYERAIRRARSADEPVVEARALVGLGTVARLINDFEVAREHYTAALEIARTVAEPRLEATVLNNLGMNETRRDEYAAAEGYVERSLELAREAGDRLAVARCLHTLGTVATRRGDPDRATDRLERSLEIKRDVGDRPGVARSLNRLGTASQKRGDNEAAGEYFERSLDIWQALGNRWWEAALLHNLGMVARVQGDYDRAERYHERALEMNRDMSVPHGVGMNLSKLGMIAEERGAYEQAREYHRRSVDVFEDLDTPQDLAYAFQYLGSTARELGEYGAAREHLERSLQLYHEVGDDHGRGECLVEFGSLARRRADLARSRGFYEAAATVFRDIGDRRRELEALVELIEAERAAGRTDAVREHCERVRGLLADATVPSDLRARAESVCERADPDGGG